MTKKDTLPAKPPKSGHLSVVLEPGKSADRVCAELAARGLVGNAATLVNFSRGGIGELSLNDCLAVLKDKGEAVNRGDMRDAEAMLAAQMVALNAMFSELARRAAINMGEHLDAMETYVKLALRAQGQCRATAEALAEMKNPRPVAFVRQANISNGPQQVNNGASSAATSEQYAQARAHAGEKQTAPNELLEDATDGRTQLDTRATPTTGRTDTALEPVGAVNRAAQ